MSGIVQVRMWKDVGFLESSTEKPMIGAVLPSADYITAEARYPSKADMFAGIEIKEDYITLMDMSYVEVTYDFNNSTPKIFYGWIDSITLKSDTDDYPLTRIDWHVDLWRTFNMAADFQAGFVQKAPSSPYPQGFDPIYWQVDSVLEMVPRFGNNLLWVYISYNQETSGGKNVLNEIYVVPVHIPIESHDYDSTPVMESWDHSQTASGMAYSYAINGLWDEILELQPSRINAAFISPLPPMPVRGLGTQESPVSLDDRFWEFHKIDGGSHFAYFERSNYPGNGGWFEFDLPLGASSIKPDDLNKYFITGWDGEQIAELPYGREITSLKIRSIVYSNTGFYQIRSDINGHMNRLCFNFPMHCLEITNNSYSEYVYSGARDYDIQMKNLNILNSLTGGLVPSALGGAIAGSQRYHDVMEPALQRHEHFMNLSNQAYSEDPSSVVGEIFAKDASKAIYLGRKAAKSQALRAGAGVGAAGILTSLVNIGVNAASQEMALQAKQTKVAKATDTMATPGNGFDIFEFGRGISLVKMVMDPISLQKRQSVLSRFGYDLNENYSDCNALILSGGPMQIANLNVFGDIPVEAKIFMKAMFAQGVNLI